MQDQYIPNEKKEVKKKCK